VHHLLFLLLRIAITADSRHLGIQRGAVEQYRRLLELDRFLR